MTSAAINTEPVPTTGAPPRWLEPLAGVLTIAVGAILIAISGDELETIAVLMGVLVVVDSVIEIIGSVFGAGDSAHGPLFGVVGVIAGVLLIRHPVTTVAAVGLIIGLWLICAGVLRLAVTLTLSGSLWGYVIALVQIAAGIAVVANPNMGVSTLAVLVGIAFVLNGLVLIIHGLVAPRHPAPA
jgi:uncharacterized membrane protein HdeD (DUF308 family)